MEDHVLFLPCNGSNMLNVISDCRNIGLTRIGNKLWSEVYLVWESQIPYQV